MESQIDKNNRFVVIFDVKTKKYQCENRNESHDNNDNVQGFYKTKKGQLSVCNSLNYINNL